MPTNLPEIKQLIADWYSLALDNPLFVGALVLIIWILAAIIYNFKILLLKKNQKAAEQVHLDVQSKLSAVEKQVQQQEEKLTSDAEQMAKDKQLVAEIKDKNLGRNQIIVESIRSIASQFDLSEQLVGSDKDMKDEFIWQQQDNIIQQLIERLSLVQREKETLQTVHQQEIAQLSDKDSVISNLQNALDMQTQQFAQLEQAIEVQKLVQQQQLKEVQQQLSNTLEKHQLDFSHLIDTVQKQSATRIVDEQEKKIPVDNVQQPDPETSAEQKIVEFSEIEPGTDANIDTLDATPDAIEPIAEQENIIESRGKDEPNVEPETVLADQLDNNVQELLNLTEPAFSTLAENESKQPGVATDAENDAPDYAKSKLNVAGKFKNLLGKIKKPSVKVEPEQKSEALATEELKVPDVTETKIEPANAESKLNVSGKFKNLLGKIKKPSVKVEPEQKIETLAAEDLNAPEIEQKIETFSSEDLTTPEAEEIEADPDYGASNFKMPGKLKSIFGKAKK